MAAANAVEIHDLHYSFPDGTPALRGVSLTVREGERVAVVGPNGAGKSTLLLHLNGVLGNGNGAVRIFGKRIAPPTIKQIRREVGLVFQNPDDQLFCPTVHDDVAFGPQNMGLTDEEIERRVSESLKAVEMEGAEKRSAFHMSYGEKKRVAIATVLAMDSPIIALDEPTSNLDPRARKHLISLLDALGRTQIIATHDLELVRRLCNRAAVMSGGRIVAEGAPRGLLSDHSFLEANGLG